jgi:uncharacterized membrane protein YdjX (TVP38/TMEM64 family)
MKLKLDKKKIFGILAILLTVAFSLFVASVPNSFFTQYIGTENIYLFMYLIALVGSISTFASIPYPLILIGLVGGGANPVYAGLASALGVVSADAFTFFAVQKGKVLLNEKLQKSVEYLGSLIEKYPKLVTPGLLLYGTCSPLSNDFAVITFSLMKFPYLKVALPLAIGNIIYNITLAYYGSGVGSFILNLF